MSETNWEERYSVRAEWMASSIIREILKFAQRDDIISLAGGWPDAGLFPVAKFDDIVSEVLTSKPGDALQYGLTDGYVPLRQAIARQMTTSEVKISADDILITSGSQQALDLVGRLFIDTGDTVLVESPTYLGAIQAWRAYGAKFQSIALDEDGMCTDLLAQTIEQYKPKLIYALPNFQNPSGVTLSLERRRQLVKIARQYGVTVIEDDPYGQLRYEGEHLPSLFELDLIEAKSHESVAKDANVIYTSTFSKTLAPGLRIAWVVAASDVRSNLIKAKQGADLHSCALSQTIAAEFMNKGWLPAQVERIRDTYRVRRDAMLQALEQYFPPTVRWTHPDGGLFLWVILPEGLDSVELLKEAVEKEKIAFVPGNAFYADGSGSNFMRLTFASVPPEVINEGIKRLGEAIARRLS